jgi:general secretion pathway protein G
MFLNNRSGFSLVEIMIVVVIIGIIGATMGNRLFGGLDRAKVKDAQNMMRNFADALEIYATDCNSYPTTEQGLQALVEEPGGSPACDSWGPKYLQKIPKDPWGNEYYYESDGGEFNIISFGKDKREGGEDFGEDIHYNQL